MNNITLCTVEAIKSMVILIGTFSDTDKMAEGLCERIYEISVADNGLFLEQ